MIREQSHPEPGSMLRYQTLMELMKISNNMTQIGWRVDRQAADAHVAKCQERYGEYYAKFCQLTGIKDDEMGKARTGQTQRVKDWFWQECKAPVVSRDKKTKNPQLNSATLVEYATTFKDKPFGPAAAALYALRKNDKYATYAKAYSVLSANDGRVHSSFLPFGTKTGRWTSGARIYVPAENGALIKYGMNIQQVPQTEPTFNFGQGDVKLVESLRNCWIADEGCVVGSADFEALELRLIAYIFGVEKLISSIEKGEDIHWTNARYFFKELNLPEKIEDGNKLHKKCRNAAKSIVYAGSYQYASPDKEGSYPTLFKALKVSFPSISEQLTAVYVKRLFEMYPNILAGQQEAKRQVTDLGYREIAISGRRLYYPDSMRGYNQAINATFQSTGAELINSALIRVAKACEWRCGSFYVLAQIHDELVCNIPQSRVEEYSSIITNSMAAPARFGEITASIPATIKTGPCWPK